MAGNFKDGCIECNKFGYSILGKKYQRVSTIKGMFNTGGALIDWAARTVASVAAGYADKYLAKEIDATTLCVMLKSPELEQAHNTERDSAADFGTLFHSIVEGLAKGNQDILSDIPDEAKRDMWADAEATWDWIHKNGVQFKLSEAIVVNDTMSYAGQVDVLAFINGERWLIDLKTSKSVYDEYSLQLAAYRNCEKIQKPDGTTIKMPRIDRCGVLHVRDGKCVLYELEAGEKEWAAFQACHRLYWWKRGVSKPKAVELSTELVTA